MLLPLYIEVDVGSYNLEILRDKISRLLKRNQTLCLLSIRNCQLRRLARSADLCNPQSRVSLKVSLNLSLTFYPPTQKTSVSKAADEREENTVSKLMEK